MQAVTRNDHRLEIWESLAERQLREAAERGEFDDLPGAGKPIPDLDKGYDPNWWAKEWLRRTKLEDAAADLRRQIRDELRRLRASADRQAARRRVAELNAAIEALNARLPENERLDLLTLDDPGE